MIKQIRKFIIEDDSDDEKMCSAINTKKSKATPLAKPLIVEEEKVSEFLNELVNKLLVRVNDLTAERRNNAVQEIQRLKEIKAIERKISKIVMLGFMNDKERENVIQKEFKKEAREYIWFLDRV
jgi:hypothetical protein